MSSLLDLGIAQAQLDAFSSLSSSELHIARVAAVDRASRDLLGDGWACRGVIAGRLAARAASHELPTVGDWVAVERVDDEMARIVAVLPRQTSFVRRASGTRTEGQAVAANVDVVFVVTAVGGDINPRRMERYVAAVYEGGATPVLVVNKADLPYDPVALTSSLAGAAPGVDIVFVSALVDDAVPALSPWLVPRTTVALVGSSGVGKSTLTNRILGDEVQATGAQRASDDRGRHTTTRRELLVSPSGVLLIDTPGMRELGAWQADEGVASAFADIEALAQACRFRDCTHVTEAGCAVLDAIDGGGLEPSRLDAWRHLQRELAWERRRVDEQAARASRDSWKAVTKAMRHRKKLDRKLDV